MPSTNPLIRTLERQVGELERAPLLQKATIAREVAASVLELVSDFDDRLRVLEQAAASVPRPAAGAVR